jgi:hypothetical protein
MANRQGKTLGPNHPERQATIQALAQLKAYQECFTESNTMFKGMIESYTQTTGPDSYNTLQCRWLRAHLVLARSGEVDKAVAELRELEGLHYVSPVLKRQIQESLQYLSSENTADECHLCSKTMDVGRISKMRCGHSHHYKCIEEHRRQNWWLEDCPTCGRPTQLWRTGQSLLSQQE